MRPLLLACCLLLCLPVPAMEAQAQIRRCVTEGGGHVYTDRQCKDLGATERAPRPSMVQQGGRLIRRDCSRSLQDLVHELTAAIDNRDVNRLAGIYHWPGMSTRGANAVMGRLDGIVSRPLVGIVPVQPAPPAPVVVAPERGSLSWRTLDRGAGSQASNEADALPPAVLAAAGQHRAARRPPTGLVVEQTVADRITPLQTMFSLRRHLDCWWLSL
ncbi:DUF4124 domain-containing protein [Luteimonas sp. SDU101]|uniref:DUF4124 domain-containing protein n=1 Tax=unclassified Luteimonas TaxID=2629088 RepID=UPI003EBEBA79